jgi:hypothetical protein
LSISFNFSARGFSKPSVRATTAGGTADNQAHRLASIKREISSQMFEPGQSGSFAEGCLGVKLK